jgi:enamine deaminase RidA (YjgF/YER057c/UK114 family)
MNGRIARRLLELQLVLPPPPLPAANYVPYARLGHLVQVSGVAPTERGAYAFVGKVGRDLDLAAGRSAARLCALNLLATLASACEGDLDRVTRFVMVRGFVNATEDFEQVPLVINGASDLIVEVFGTDVGRHARTSIGCATLPGRVAVEVDALVSIDRGG